MLPVYSKVFNYGAYMRLLLVEDEVKLSSNLKKLLKGESYSIDVSDTGAYALELANTTNYDVIILDLGLLDMSGLEVCKKFREQLITSPILILTARDDVFSKVKALDSGADDYLVKPFEFNELTARLRALLRRNTAVLDTIYSIDSLEIYPDKKLCVREGRDVALSAKEYALLEYLIRNKDKVISKSQLIDHVWDDGLDPFSNVVDVYIGYVRNKIDKAFPDANPLVHTIKGLGYKLSL